MKLPPGPQTPPKVQMLQWIVSPMSYMEACAQRYGDLFTLRIGQNSTPVVFVSNPQAHQEILTGDLKEFEAPGETNKVFQPLLGNQSVILVSRISTPNQSSLGQSAF